jgi:hypothetical protein
MYCGGNVGVEEVKSKVPILGACVKMIEYLIHSLVYYGVLRIVFESYYEYAGKECVCNLLSYKINMGYGIPARSLNEINPEFLLSLFIT